MHANSSAGMLGRRAFYHCRNLESVSLPNNNKADKVNDGIVHVSASMDHYNWIFHEDNPRLNLGKWNTAIKRAMIAADKFVDFSKYDRNGNNKIETNEMALGFIVAGGEATCLHPKAN